MKFQLARVSNSVLALLTVIMLTGCVTTGISVGGVFIPVGNVEPELEKQTEPQDSQEQQENEEQDGTN